MLIKIDTDQFHVPRLAFAQQVARTAHVEIAGADAEACPKAVERLKRAQPLERGVGNRGIAIGQQQDLPATAAASHAAAQLVQLRQAEAICAPHDHGVGARHVEPGFDDVGGQQHIAAPGRKFGHRSVERVGGHLAMGLDDLAFGEQLGETRGDHRHVLDPRHDHEALPAPGTLAQQGSAHMPIIPAFHHGADRLAARRGRGDDRHLLQPDERRLQRAGDRGC